MIIIDILDIHFRYSSFSRFVVPLHCSNTQVTSLLANGQFESVRYGTLIARAKDAACGEGCLRAYGDTWRTARKVTGKDGLVALLMQAQAMDGSKPGGLVANG